MENSMFYFLCFLTFVSGALIITHFFSEWMQSRKESKFYLSIYISSFIILLTITISYKVVLNDLYDSFPDYDKIGAYGDYIGGIINPVIAFVAVIATSSAFFIQYQANEQIKEQFDTQQDKDYEQNFQNQLFKIIDFHHNIIENIEIDLSITDFSIIVNLINDFPYEIGVEKNQYLFKVFSKQGDLKLNGRNAFKFISEMTSEAIKLINFSTTEVKKKKSSPATPQELMRIDNLKKFNKQINVVLKRGKLRINNSQKQDYLPTIIDLVYKQIEFQFTHYFTNFCRGLKIINSSEFKNKKEEKEYYYASILRAQLSEQELKLIFINGINTELQHEAKYKGYIELYCILKNINKKSYIIKEYKDVFDTSAFKRT